MKLHERINYILLGTLWCLAILLLLDFTMNTVYNFNIFSAAHWQFVANIQAANRPIAPGFYVIISLAIILCIAGLFILCRPRLRKIILKTNDATPQAPHIPPVQAEPVKPVPVALEPAVSQQSTPISMPEPKLATESLIQPEPTITPQPEKQAEQTPVIQRPPHLHIQKGIHVAPPKPRPTEQKPVDVEKPVALYVDELRDIFEKNNYRVLSAKTISGVPLSLIALGSDETLWLGATDISHEQMTNVMLAFQSVFKETLEDIEIDINAFIINPTDTDSVDAILDFDSVTSVDHAINAQPNEPESAADAESGNMDAFAGYIETVLTYLGNK